MITLLGHGYVGSEIAKELTKQGIIYSWQHHNDWVPFGVVINAAGVTGHPNVDACESNKESTILGNVLFPLRVEQATNSPVIHIGSGCVYNGHEKDWSEEDEPNFSFDNGSFYSGTKALGQEVLKPYLHKSYLLRIRMPFGKEDHPKNFLTKMRQYPKLIDVRNSLSRVEDVAKVAVWFALHLPKPGIYNVCNPGSVQTREVVDLMGLEKDWFTQEEFSKHVKVPRSSCVMDTRKLEAIYPMPDVKTALKECL